MALHAVGQLVVDGSPAGREHVSAREQDGGIEKGILKVGVAIQELLPKKRCVLHVGKERHMQRVIWQMRKRYCLHCRSEENTR